MDQAKDEHHEDKGLEAKKAAMNLRKPTRRRRRFVPSSVPVPVPVSASVPAGDDDDDNDCKNSGEGRGRQTRMNGQQRKILKDSFHLNQYWSKNTKTRLAKLTGLSYAKVSTWFYSQRSRERVQRALSNESSTTAAAAASVTVTVTDQEIDVEKMVDGKLRHVCEEFTSKLLAIQDTSKQELAKIAANLVNLYASGDAKEGRVKSASKTDTNDNLSALVDAACGKIRSSSSTDNRQCDGVIDLTNDDENEPPSLCLVLPPLLVSEEGTAGKRQKIDEVIQLEKALKEQRGETKKLRSWVKELLYAIDQSAAEKRRRQATMDCVMAENDRLRSHASRLKYEKVHELNRRGQQLKEAQERNVRLSQKVRELEGEVIRTSRPIEPSTGHSVGRVEALERELQLSNQRVKYLESAYKQSCIEKLNAEQEARAARMQADVARNGPDNGEIDLDCSDDLLVSELDGKSDTTKDALRAVDDMDKGEHPLEYYDDVDCERIDDPVDNIRKEMQKQAALSWITPCVVRVNKMVSMEMPMLLPKREPDVE